jgi:DNA-binding CsgD family transcriptional regulator
MRPRERECYELMKLGLTTAEIAAAMNITWAGAKAHRKRVNRQIGIAERDRLARPAKRGSAEWFFSGLVESAAKSRKQEINVTPRT